MEIVVNDANLFFDLLKADLIKDFFKLHFEVFTTDFVLGEVTDEKQLEIIGDLILNKELHVFQSDFETYSKIIQLSQQVAGLSIPDCSVWYLSKEKNYTLLTGDKLLRNTAMKDNITVKGLLYVFDQLVYHNIITPILAAEKLQFLIDTGTRLPTKECSRRIETWKKVV